MKTTVFFSAYGGTHCMFGGMSCEHIAVAILEAFSEVSWAEVWEENTGGGRVERDMETPYEC